MENKNLMQEAEWSHDARDNWTCGCLYKCNDCIKLDESGESRLEHFERKDPDYMDE